MGVCGEKIPYSNFHDTNLDWIMSKIGDIDKGVEDAKKSASEAADSASKAAGSASASAGSASEAAESASDAAINASASAGSASEAAASASESAGSASDAAESASDAAINASASAGSASEASSSANAAENSKNTAASIANIMSLILPTYSASATYSVGSYVKYGDNAYKCIVAITVPEAWTLSHWELVGIGDEIENLNDSISDIIDHRVNYYRLDDTYTQGHTASTGFSIKTHKNDYVKVVVKMPENVTTRYFVINLYGSDGNQYESMRIERGSGEYIFKVTKTDANIEIIGFSDIQAYTNVETHVEIFVSSTGFFETNDIIDHLASITTAPLRVVKCDPGFCSMFRSWGFIGDSISAGEHNAYVGSTPVYADLYDYSFGSHIVRMCNADGFVFAKGGQTTKGWIEDNSDRGWGGAKTNVKDVYTIFLGINDTTANYPVGDADTDIGDYDPITDSDTNADTFVGYYAGIIQRIKSIQPKTKIFILTIPDGAVVDPTTYNRAITSISGKFSNVYLIDLYTHGVTWKNAEWSNRYRDQYHLNAAGYLYMAWQIMTYIDWIVRNNWRAFNNTAFIGTDYSDTPE